MSQEAFNLTAYYDSVISDYLCSENNILRKNFHGNLVEVLRYGENPHQNQQFIVEII